MRRVLVLLLLLHCFNSYSDGTNGFIPSKREVVKIGALFTFNSTIGRGAKVAIEAAIEDINLDPGVLNGTRLEVVQQDTICNGFVGIAEALQFREANVVAIIGPQSSVIAHVISHVANELQVPLLSFAATDPTLSSLEYPFFIRTTRSDLFVMAAIAEIVDHYQWSQVVAVYIDDDYGRNGITALGNQLAERRCKISYKAPLPIGSTRDDVMDLLIKVALMESRIIVVHANPDSGTMILSVANYLGMMSQGYVWIASDWLTSLLDNSASLPAEIMNTMQGVLGLRQHIPDSHLRSSFISKWTNLTSKVGSFGLNTYAMYAYDTVWVVAHALDAFFSNGGVISFADDMRLHNAIRGKLNLEAMRVFSSGRLLRDMILKVDMVGLTGRIHFDPDRHIFQPAYDIINVIGSGIRTIGYWSNHSGLSVELPEKLYQETPNHSRANQLLRGVIWPGGTILKPRGWVFPNNGKELRVGFPRRVGYKEFVMQVGGVDMAKGYCIDVFTAAAKLLPYPVPFKFIPFGDGLKNPNYRDLVNSVASGELDAAVGDIAIVTNRTRIVDFTQPYIESGLVILAAVKKQETNLWAFMRPFTIGMWVVTGLFFLVVGLVVWILEHRLNDDFRGPPRKQFVTILWFSFSTLFFAHKENTKSTMGRLVLLIWLFVVLIIQSSYTANLTSILTVQQLSSTIKGIDGLIASNDPIGFQVGSFAENYMVEELGISRSRLRVVYTPEDYARALELGPENGGVAAIVDERPYIDLFLSTQCKFAIIGSEFTRSGWGFVFQRDSPLAIDMSTAILTWSENGDLQRIHDKWLARRSSCSTQAAELNSDRLHLSSFQGLFIISGVACFLALLAHFIRTVYKFCQHFSHLQPDPIEPTSSRASHVLRSFMSFVNEKEEHVHTTSPRKQAEN